MVRYRNQYNPLTFTFLGMMVTVVVFYPLFIKLESWVKDLSIRAIKSGKSVAGKYMGLLLVFAVGLLVLSYFYAKMWYHINIFQLLLHTRL
jgi:hypothetical protein